MKTFKEIQTSLRETAGELLRAGEVDVFLGYRKTGMPFRTRPAFVRRPEEAGEIVWSSFCANNLAVYLPRLFRSDRGTSGKQAAPPRVGVVVKPCDARCVCMLAQERQIPRGRIVLVGVHCHGVVDRRKAEAALKGVGVLGAGEDDVGNIRAVIDNGSDVTLPRAALLADACLECSDRSASDVDFTFGDPPPIEKSAGGPRSGQRAVPLEERWARFTAAIGRCIRCNACRQACPQCYCKECFADQTCPRWVGGGDDPSDLAIFHLARAMHLTGRCTDCGACSAACPVGVDTRLLIREMNRDAEQIYGYRAGVLREGKPLLSEFDMGDPQDFVVEP